MMYKVVHDVAGFQRVLFRSREQTACWIFIAQRLNHFDPVVRTQARQFTVIDSLDRKYYPSTNFRAA